MGRPIKKIFMGERAAGGEGVASVTITTAGTGYADGTLVFSAPDINGGTLAEGTYTQTGGLIDVVTVTVPGTGYTSAPTVTPSDAVGSGAALTAVLTSTGTAVIAATAVVTGSNLAADMLSQKGTTRYRVSTTEGTLDCTLVQATPTAVGEMAIAATDSTANTYWVKKLFNNTVIVEQNTGGSWEFANNEKVKWGDTAVLNDTVKITT